MGRHSEANISQDMRPSRRKISHCLTYLNKEHEGEGGGGGGRGGERERERERKRERK